MLTSIVVNTVESKHHFREGGWELVEEQVGPLRCNPNYAITPATLKKVIRDNNKVICIGISQFMKELRDAVNEHFNYKVMVLKGQSLTIRL